MAVPMKTGGMKSIKVIFYVILSGVTTGIGAFFGSIIGGIRRKYNSNMFKFCSTEQCFI